MEFVKKVILWASLVAVFYVLLAFHYVYFGGTQIRFLKKSEYTLKYTFFSTHGKTVEKILSIDELREAGIGDLLVDMGLMKASKLERIMAKYEEEEYD